MHLAGRPKIPIVKWQVEQHRDEGWTALGRSSTFLPKKMTNGSNFSRVRSVVHGKRLSPGGHEVPDIGLNCLPAAAANKGNVRAVIMLKFCPQNRLARLCMSWTCWP